MAEELRDLRCLEDETGDIAKAIVSQSLYNLRNEEERKFDWVLGQDTVGVLQYEGIAVVPLLEECVGDDGRDGCPEE